MYLIKMALQSDNFTFFYSFPVWPEIGNFKVIKMTDQRYFRPL